MAFTRYGTLKSIAKITFIVIIAFSSVHAYNQNTRTNYRGNSPYGYRSDRYAKYNEPAFSIKENLKSTKQSSFQERVENTNVANELEDNGMWYVGAQQAAAHPVHAPHVVAHHVVEPRPHLVKHVEHVEPKKPEAKPIIDPFKDEEAQEIAAEEFEIIGEVQREEAALEHERICRDKATEYHNVNLNLCPCQEEVVAAPVQFFEHGDEKKVIPLFYWWLLPLLIIGLLLIALLLALFYQRKPVIPTKKYVIERQTKEEDEAEIEAEIQRQLEAKMAAKIGGNEEIKVRDEPVVAASPPAPIENSPANSSSKKVVKKRIVKMMKEGRLVAEKEEILDEEGNVLKTQIRKQEE